jgi:hypothetical protein
MATNLSPAVTIVEQNASQSVPSVTTSVGAMVMHTTKGAVNVRTLVTSPSDLQDKFGIPNDVDYTHWFNAEAFVKVSNQLYVVRVEADTKACAGVTVGLSATGMGNIVLSTPTTEQVVNYPLAYNEIKLHEAKINYGLPPGTGTGELDNAANNLYNEDVYHFYAVGPGTYYDEISVTVVNANDWNVLVAFKGALSEATTQTAINAIAQEYYTGVPATTAAPAIDLLSNSLIKYDVITPPTGDSTTWFVNTGTLAVLTNFEVGPQTADEGLLIVWDENDSPAEAYVFSNLQDKLNGLGDPEFGPQIVNGNSSYIYFFIGNSIAAAAGIPVVTVNQTFLGDADLLTGDIPGTGLGDLTSEILTAWETFFSNAEDISVDLLIDPDYPDVVKQYLDQLCSTIRMDCMAVLNVPQQYMQNTTDFQPIANPFTTMSNYVANILNIDSSYSAIYGNYFLIYNRFTQQNVWVPVAGYVAATIAFTDFSNAPWFAPAGLNRGIISNVISIAVNPNKGQRDVLYYNAINPIAKFQNLGIVIWGQKTMISGASAFNRINVRRLFLYLEKTVKLMAQYFLFEFNDSQSQSNFVGRVNPFLTDVKAGRGVYDFLVVCNSTNNPPEVVDANQFNADILVKPARAAEFIQLTFTAVGTGVDFSEVVVS